MNLLGIDIGTTSLKAAAFTEEGELLERFCEEYTLDTVGDTIEFDADRYIEMTERAIKSLEKYNSAALAVDTQGETMIVTDENGVPLRKAIVWLDNRATAEADELREKFGEEAAYYITGQAEISPTWPAAKLLWIKKHEPEVFGKIKKIFMLADYVNYKLTGNFTADRNMQSSTLYFNVNTGDWWDEMLSYIGITRDMLPELVESGTKIGTHNGMTVGAGALDQIAACVGTGVVGGDKSIVSEMTGTVLAVCAESEKLPPYTRDRFVPCHWSVGGKYCLIMWSPTAGMTLKWFRDNFCEGMSFADLDKLAEKVPAGCEGLTMSPHLCGMTIPKSDPNARGNFEGIGLQHTRGHFVRAILEAVARMLGDCVDCLDEKPAELRATGGGAMSGLWCQIKADTVGVPLCTVECPETACLGSAMLAGMAHGVYASLSEASGKAVKIKNTYIPKK
nr:hypothetical protein [Clostridia bacterium]